MCGFSNDRRGSAESRKCPRSDPRDSTTKSSRKSRMTFPTIHASSRNLSARFPTGEPNVINERSPPDSLPRRAYATLLETKLSPLQRRNFPSRFHPVSKKKKARWRVHSCIVYIYIYHLPSAIFHVSNARITRVISPLLEGEGSNLRAQIVRG